MKDTLRHGDRGSAVRVLQTTLNALGANLAVDGVFGDVTFDLVCDFQTRAGLDPDGIVGPKTWKALNQGLARLKRSSPTDALSINAAGVLEGPGVTPIFSHPSWYGGTLAGGAPGGVVCHVSDTGPGTAPVMARGRLHPFIKNQDRLASWHATVDTDGSIVQQVPFHRVAWHAGSSTAQTIPGLGWANYCTVGIELVGYPSGPFPEAQVLGYARLLKALVERYGIPSRFAMLEHSEIDPKRRTDPGKEWMSKHAQRVLELAYGDRL